MVVRTFSLSDQTDYCRGEPLMIMSNNLQILKTSIYVSGLLILFPLRIQGLDQRIWEPNFLFFFFFFFSSFSHHLSVPTGHRSLGLVLFTIHVLFEMNSLCLSHTLFKVPSLPFVYNSSLKTPNYCTSCVSDSPPSLPTQGSVGGYCSILPLVAFPTYSISPFQLAPHPSCRSPQMLFSLRWLFRVTLPH